MEYILGYILTCFVLVVGLGYAIASLRRKVPDGLRASTKKPPQIRSHALISFSVILPFSALAFLVLNFPAMKIAQSQGLQGHVDYIVTALFLPTVCFLAGYFYFKKSVKQ